MHALIRKTHCQKSSLKLCLGFLSTVFDRFDASEDCILLVAYRSKNQGFFVGDLALDSIHGNAVYDFLFGDIANPQNGRRCSVGVGETTHA